jgi:hypothetical protein
MEERIKVPINLQELLSFMGFILNEKKEDIDIFEDRMLEQLILFTKEELYYRRRLKKLH